MSRTLATNRQAATNRVMPQDMKASLRFATAGDAVTITPTGVLASVTNNMTYQAKFKLNSMPSSTASLIIKGNDTDPETSPVDLAVTSTGKLQFNYEYGVGTNVSHTVSSFSCKPGTWYEAVATIDENNAVKIYANGNLIYSGGNANAPTDTSANTIRLFGDAGAGHVQFFGNGSECRIWNTALTHDQIRDLYFNNIVPTPGLVGEWKLDEGAGATAYDTSGNGNHGTITGATWSADVPSKARKQVGGNLVRNGDFSYVPPFVAFQAAGGWLDGTATGSSVINPHKIRLARAGTVEMGFDASTPWNGRPSFKLSTKAAGSYAECFLDAIGYDTKITEGFSLKPSTSYMLSYRMKTNLVSGSSNNGAAVMVYEANGVGTNLGISHGVPDIRVTTDWTEYVYPLTTKSITRRGHLGFYNYGHTGAGTLIMDAWFANISLTEVGGGRVVA